MLWCVAWIPLAVAPVLLLLLIQVQFLPFHSLFVTWTQRLALLVDLWLIWWLWGKVRSGREVDGARQKWVPHISSAARFASILAVILFAGTVATFSGEWQEVYLASWQVLPAPNEWATQQPFRDWIVNSKKLSLHDWVFNSPVDPTTRRRLLPFSDTLVLTGFNVLEGLGIDDPEKSKWRDFVYLARGRNLKGAIFDFASLPRVDFTGADLEGASFRSAQLDRNSFDGAALRRTSLDLAQLKGASFRCERLPGNKLRCAKLQGASLDRAELEGARLDSAQLQGASLDGAQLRGATLIGADFQGASLIDAELRGALLGGAEFQDAQLDNAHLQGAQFDNAHLQGARLDGADLQGALLFSAQLQNASLSRTQLQGAQLDNAHLQGASLNSVQLQGASLQDAQLRGASLIGAQLQGALLDSAQLQGTSLDGADFQGASLERAKLWGASFYTAQLQGASLRYAQLWGASLDHAQFQGASLQDAQLQGASLQQATLRATDLSNALLWRSDHGSGGDVAAIKLPNSPDQWSPLVDEGEVLPWNDKAYHRLRDMLEFLPPGRLRDQTLDRIEILDCTNPDKTLAPCDPSVTSPPEAAAWQKSLEAARVDEQAYALSLAKTLKELVCSGGDDAIHVLRGAGFQSRLEAAGLAASDLIDGLTNKDSKNCPVPPSLIDADKAELLRIKEDAIKKPGG